MAEISLAQYARRGEALGAAVGRRVQEDVT
jgi:hypothetical protein